MPDHFIRTPFAKLLLAGTFVLLAACASKPEPDRLVLLGDAQAAGDTVREIALARALLAVWLGDAPPNPELKTGLLGGGCE